MLYGWMKSIIIYLILSGIVVNLAPGNNYKKYVHFFTGLLLLIIIAEPVTFLFKIGSFDIDKLMSDINHNISYDSNGMDTDIYNYYELSINDSIEKYLYEMGFTPKGVEIITDEEYKILKCTINYVAEEGNNAGFDEESKQEIKNKISDVYNVEIDNIYIVSR